MKTKLTFLLSFTFLFLFSGSVYGRPIVVSSERVKKLKEEAIKERKERFLTRMVIFCPGSEGGFEKYISVNMKEMTITTYNLRGNAVDTVYNIIEENAVAVEGVGTSELLKDFNSLPKEGMLNREQMETLDKITSGNIRNDKSITVHRNSHPDKKNLIEVWWGDFPKKALCLIMDKKF